MLDVVGRDFARIDFDRVFAMRHELEMTTDCLHQARHLCIRQEGGRTPAKVELGQLRVTLQVLGMQGQFALEIIQIGIRA